MPGTFVSFAFLNPRLPLQGRFPMVSAFHLPPSTNTTKGSRGSAPAPRHTHGVRSELPVSSWSVSRSQQGRTKSPPCLSLARTDDTETVRFGHFVSFPPVSMIYQIKLQYGFLVDAPDQSTAYMKAVRALRDNPGSHISNVAEAPASKKKSMSLLMRIIKGV